MFQPFFIKFPQTMVRELASSPNFGAYGNSKYWKGARKAI